MKLSAQSQSEVDLLKSLSPMYKTNKGFTIVSQTAQPLSFAVPFSLLAVALIKDDKKLEYNSYEIAGSVAAAVIATSALKAIIDRPRPYQKYSRIYADEVENSSSFPSAHTSMAFATATSLSLIYKRWYVSVPCYLWASTVGFSRLYLGQHYPSDVLAGAAVGIGSAYASRWLNKKLFTKKKLVGRGDK